MHRFEKLEHVENLAVKAYENLFRGVLPALDKLAAQRKREREKH